MAKILLPIPENGLAKELVFDLRALVAKSHPEQSFKILINQIPSPVFHLRHFDNNKISVLIPPSERVKPHLEIDFVFLSPISPHDLGLGNGDARAIAIGLKSLEIR